MKRFGIVILVLVIALLSACGSRAPAPATSASDAPASPAVVTQGSGSSSAQGTDKPVDSGGSTDNATEEGDDLQLTDEEGALKKLRSYKTTWSFEWTGAKDDGAEQTVKWLSEEWYTSDPKASYTKFDSSDTAQATQGGAMEFYQIGSKAYMVTTADGQPQCTAFTSEDNTASQSMLDRSAFGSISNGKLIGVETVNGVRAKHYQYDEKATGVNFFSKLTGDVWVAEDGGYIVRDVANWEGNIFGLLGSGASGDVGKGSWTREVTEINQPFEITPPEGCENIAEGLPKMADATDVTSFGGMTTYKTGGKMADVVKFYQAEMGKAGWTAGENPQISDSFATLAFTKDGKLASVILTADETAVNVMIQVE